MEKEGEDERGKGSKGEGRRKGGGGGALSPGESLTQAGFTDSLPCLTAGG